MGKYCIKMARKLPKNQDALVKYVENELEKRSSYSDICENLALFKERELNYLFFNIGGHIKYRKKVFYFLILHNLLVHCIIFKNLAIIFYYYIHF